MAVRHFRSLSFGDIAMKNIVFHTSRTLKTVTASFAMLASVILLAACTTPESLADEQGQLPLQVEESSHHVITDGSEEIGKSLQRQLDELDRPPAQDERSEEHTSELQSRGHPV